MRARPKLPTLVKGGPHGFNKMTKVHNTTSLSKSDTNQKPVPRGPVYIFPSRVSCFSSFSSSPSSASPQPCSE